MEEQNTPVETTENATNVPTKKDDPAPVNSEVESSRPIEAVYDVPVIVSVVLGSAKMPVSDLLKLTRGSIVELERHLGDPVDIYVNNRLIAKGEVVSVDDRLAITMTEVIKIIK